MGAFMIAASLLMLGALVWLLPPLLSAAQGWATARRLAGVLAIALPLAAAALYARLGDTRWLRPHATSAAAAPRAATTAPAGPEQATAQQSARIAAQAAALSDRLRVKPDDAAGWAALARAYILLGRWRDAVAAFERADAIAPGDATLLADWADVLGMAQGRRLAGTPVALIKRALDQDPRHVKALSLAGSAALELRDGAAARGYWQRLLELLPPDAPLARSARGSLAQAEAMDAATTGGAAPATVAGGAAPPAMSAPTEAATTDAAAAIEGQVEIGPALAARVQPGDTLFVFARAVEGPRMPLAIVRRAVGEWPARFTLDDTQAMSPALRLSGFARVTVHARIARHGDATPRPGDLIGQSAALAPGARGVRVLIDHVQP